MMCSSRSLTSKLVAIWTQMLDMLTDVLALLSAQSDTTRVYAQQQLGQSDSCCSRTAAAGTAYIQSHFQYGIGTGFSCSLLSSPVPVELLSHVHCTPHTSHRDSSGKVPTAIPHCSKHLQYTVVAAALSVFPITTHRG